MTKRISLIVLAACAALNALAKTSGDELPSDPNLVRGTLQNGLTYIIRHNEHPKDRANFYIAQRVGAVLEDDSQDGLAHFLEHMAFNGTKNFPDKGIIDFLENVGVKFGENINAYTAYDETVYNLDNVPTTNLNIVDSALLVLHDWSGFITLDGEEIDKERGVIREEWRTRNTASRRIYFAHNRNTKKGTPYEVRDVIGDTAVINNFTYDEQRKYYQKWNRPDLQGIIVVGDVDASYIEEKIKELWKDIPAKKKPAERVFNRLNDNSEPIASVVTDPEATRTTVEAIFRHDAMPFALRNTRAYYEAGIRNSIFENAINLRFDELTNKQSASSSGAFIEAYNDAPLTEVFHFYAAAKTDSTLSAINFLLDEVEKIRRFGLTQSEFEIAKISIAKAYEDAYESRGKRKNDSYTREYVSSFTDCEPVPGIENELVIAKEMLEKITLDDVNRMLSERLTQNVVLQISAPTSDTQVPSEQAFLELYNSSLTKPLEAYESKQYAENLIDQAPEAGTIAEREHTAWDSEEWTLSNGVRVILMPTENVDNQVLFSAMSYGGISVLEPSEVLNANMVGQLATQSGKGDYDINELQRILANKSVALSASVGRYFESLSGQSTTGDFSTLMQLVNLSFAPMRNDADAFGTLIDAYKTKLANASKNPQNAIADTLNTTLMNGNEYYRPIRLENIEELDHQKIMEIYNERFANAADFTFFVVGDFVPDSIESDITTWLGSLPTTSERESYVPRDFYYPTGKIEKVFTRQMETHKSTNRIVYSGRDEYSLKKKLTLDIVSNMLDMRYLDTIREEEGGSYGVHCRSQFGAMVEQEFSLSISFDTDPALIDRLLPMIEKEISEIANGNASDVDFRKVKENFIKKRKEQKQNNSFWISALSNKIMANIDSVTDYESTVESITLDDVCRMARQVLDAGNVVTVRMMPE